MRMRSARAGGAGRGTEDRATVVKFLDDVAVIWTNPDKETYGPYKESKIKNRELIEAWKKEILDGKIPTDRKWRLDESS